MKKAETLLEIKRIEAAIRAMKESAGQERDRIVRKARREVLELEEGLRAEAEQRSAVILRAAEGGIAKEREALLAKGRQEAEARKAAGMANVDRAIEVVLSKFQGALDA